MCNPKTRPASSSPPYEDKKHEIKGAIWLLWHVYWVVEKMLFQSSTPTHTHTRNSRTHSHTQHTQHTHTAPLRLWLTPVEGQMVCVTLVFLSQWLLFVHHGNTEPSRHKLLLRSRGGVDSRRGLRSKKRVVEVFLLDDHTGPCSRTPLCLFLTLVTWM